MKSPDQLVCLLCPNFTESAHDFFLYRYGTYIKAFEAVESSLGMTMAETFSPSRACCQPACGLRWPAIESGETRKPTTGRKPAKFVGSLDKVGPQLRWLQYVVRSSGSAWIENGLSG